MAAASLGTKIRHTGHAIAFNMFLGKTQDTVVNLANTKQLGNWVPELLALVLYDSIRVETINELMLGVLFRSIILCPTLCPSIFANPLGILQCHYVPPSRPGF